MARLPAVDLEAVQEEGVREGFDDMIRRMGAVTDNLKILAHKPVYVELIRAVSDAIDSPTEIDPVLKQLVELKTARLSGCEYSVDLLEACLLQKGVPEAKLHELDFYEESTLYDETERLAIKFAERMFLDSVDDTLFNEVRRAFSVVEALELIVTVGLESFYCLVNRTLGLKPQRLRARTESGLEPSGSATAR